MLPELITSLISFVETGGSTVRIPFSGNSTDWPLVKCASTLSNVVLLAEKSEKKIVLESFVSRYVTSLLSNFCIFHSSVELNWIEFYCRGRQRWTHDITQGISTLKCCPNCIGLAARWSAARRVGPALEKSVSSGNSQERHWHYPTSATNKCPLTKFHLPPDSSKNPAPPTTSNTQGLSNLPSGDPTYQSLNHVLTEGRRQPVQGTHPQGTGLRALATKRLSRRQMKDTLLHWTPWSQDFLQSSKNQSDNTLDQKGKPDERPVIHHA